MKLGNFPFLLRWETRAPLGGRKRLAMQNSEVLPVRSGEVEQTAPTTRVEVPAGRWAFIVTGGMEEGGCRGRKPRRV